MGRLFGTDGVRGVANTELTCEMAMAIGRAAAMVLTAESGKRPKVLIGKDTRASGDMLETALCAGLCSVGADVHLLGVVPTPAVAFLVKAYTADAAVMISASHNPCEYNGIKIFNGEGFKLSDGLEEEIEAIVLDNAKTIPTPTGGDVGRVYRCEKAVDDYVRHLLSTVSVNLQGLHIAVDCANGSASVTAKKLFDALGVRCEFLSCTPDGVNINDGCGSTYLEPLAAYVKKHKLDGGVAFDGDADRCLAVDENGNVIDGDQMIAAMATDLKAQGALKGNVAVVTVMSNLGFFRYCEDAGIEVAATKVGDRYVLEEMVKEDYVIGGEQSGHIILRAFGTTGDGQLSAIHLLSVARRNGWKLSRVGSMMQRYPQVLLNVRADTAQKALYHEIAQIAALIEEVDASLGKNGRVLVRPSGTEPLIRVMVEGKDFEVINDAAVTICEAIKNLIGG